MKTLPVAAELLSVYEEHLKSFIPSKGDVRRLKSLRPSQLPFCPVDFFIQHASHGLIRSTDMRSSYYMSVGTTVHTVLQNYLSRSGRFLASWQCTQCRKRYEVTMQNECCDFPMRYEEIGIKYKGVEGHIDAVFKDKMGNYWIVDFKTTSMAGAKKKLTDPGISYIEQVEAYALMLYLQYGIKVKGTILMFIKRDNPAKPIIWGQILTEARFSVIKDRLKADKKKHKQVLAVATMEEAIALAKYGRCKNKYCKTCNTCSSLKPVLKAAFKKGTTAKRLPLLTMQ